VFASAVGGSTFARIETLTSSSAGYKSQQWKNIPHVISQAPFGVGLGTVGSAASFGGKLHELLPEGRGVSGETQYNLLTDEVGAPGLIIWVGLALTVLLLTARKLRSIADPELRISLAALAAPLYGFLLIGFTGPIVGSAALGPYFWFAAGVAAYWFGSGKRMSGARTQEAT